MRDCVWAFQGIIYVAPNCYNCGSDVINGDLNGQSTTVVCVNCKTAYFKSIKEARQHYPMARIVLQYP